VKSKPMTDTTASGEAERSRNVVPHNKPPIVVMRERLMERKDELRNALTDIDPDHFIRVLITAAQINPELQACSFQSLWLAIMRACRDNLLPDSREGVIVAFKSTAQWIPMYQGLLKRFRQSGQCKWITADVVRKGERFEHFVDQYGEHFYHQPEGDDAAPIEKVYAAATTKDGGFYCAVLSITEINKIKAISKTTREDSPWKMWPNEMMKKTALRRLSKALPAGRDIFQDDPSSPEFGAVSGVAKAETESEAETERPPGAAAALETFAGPTPEPAAGHREPSKAAKMADDLLDEIEKTTGSLYDPSRPVTIERDDEGEDGDNDGLEPVDYGEYADSDDELPLGKKDQAHDRASG
jgi:phage RecT family recombinase